MDVPAEARDRWRMLRVVGPYLITGAVALVIAARFDVAQVGREMLDGDASALIPVAVILLLLTLVLIAAADRLVLRALGADVSLSDCVRAKAASSLLDIVGYAWGHGGLAVWIARKSGCGARDAAAALLYIMAADLTAVLVVASAATIGASAVGLPSTVPASLEIGAPVAAAILLFLLAVGPYEPLGRPPRVFSAWAQVPRRVGGLQLLLRICQITLFVIATRVAAAQFGIFIPASAAAAYLPIIALITALPVNVAGFGVAQGAWLMFEPWAPAERLLAFSVLWNLTFAVVLSARGLPFLRAFVGDVAAGRPRAASAVAQDVALRGGDEPGCPSPAAECASPPPLIHGTGLVASAERYVDTD